MEEGGGGGGGGEEDIYGAVKGALVDTLQLNIEPTEARLINVPS